MIEARLNGGCGGGDASCAAPFVPSAPCQSPIATGLCRGRPSRLPLKGLPPRFIARLNAPEPLSLCCLTHLDPENCTSREACGRRPGMGCLGGRGAVCMRSYRSCLPPSLHL